MTDSANRPTTMPSASDVFPTLHACARLVNGTEDDTVYDVQFYPYGTDDDEQIFAVVTGFNVIVCRPSLEVDQGFEILRWLKDEQKPQHPVFNSLVWTKDPVSNKPLICVAGHQPKHIKILDVESGKALDTLSGHGRGINGLAVSPLSTSLLASCAEDSTIRLWNLEPEYRHQPCVALFAGEGHKQPILAIHFHPNGRWLLSGGIDTAICLWAVPELDELLRDSPEAKDKEPMIVYYPSFYTKELHSNYVDCVEFYGDLIISKAARDQEGSEKNKNEILIWKIDGFDSNAAPPSEAPIPMPGVQTRSGFEHDSRFRGFQRLVTLSLTHCDRFYHRFGLLHTPDMVPLVAFGNQQSLYSFWDLHRLEKGTSLQEIAQLNKRRKGRKKKNGPTEEKMDRMSAMRGSENPAEGTESSSNPSTAPDRESTLDDRFSPIKPHHKRKLPDIKQYAATSQISWSPDGTWMIGVGDLGTMTIWHRDKSVVGYPTTEEGEAD